MENNLEDFWGVCLDGNNKKAEWNGTDIGDLEGVDDDLEQTLELRQACLGVNPKDERNVVNVTTESSSGEIITQTILSMKMNLHEQTQLFLTLYPPVTLELVHGTGPVYISGTVTSRLNEPVSSGEEEEEEEEEEEIDDKDTSVSPAVQKAVGKKRPADSPIQKPAKAIKVGKKDDKGAKGLKSKKPSQEEDDDDDEDFDDIDEEDEDDSEGEGEEEDSEEEEETKSKPTKQKKNEKVTKKPQTIATTPKSGTPAAKESGKKQQGKEPMSIDDVKDKLLKTPTIPKKVDKFNNYITNSYKITDDKIKKQLWEFVQKNRPQS